METPPNPAIGVIANPEDAVAVREFFELFKTPWEFYRVNRQYETLLCCGEVEIPAEHAGLAIVYVGRPALCDAPRQIEASSQASSGRMLELNGQRIPAYGESMMFRERHGDSAMVVRETARGPLVRIGYNLFDEVRRLLTNGQPMANADIPTLDLHISVLRRVLVENGARFVEIPPQPCGHAFWACLTHDLDHPLFRCHKFDHTMLGFLWRATASSVMRWARGRLDFCELLQNLLAALKAPLVHLGLATDFWQDFDRYLQLERGAASTFFVIPFKGRAGDGAPARRASAYGAEAIAEKLVALAAAGCEIGLHGIDAWHDAEAARREYEEIRRTAGVRDIGVRMHWLYFDEQSPARLEEAGVAYDSSVGYNETVGFRAGTTQVYKPLHNTHLLELPLHVMDTALFYPAHLNLSPKEARGRVQAILSHAIEFGGCVTINWHDRSIAPERQWGRFYGRLVDKCRALNGRLSSAEQAVAWFRMRRSAAIEDVEWEPYGVQAKISVDSRPGLPDLLLRVHGGGECRGEVCINRPAIHIRFGADINRRHAVSCSSECGL